MLGSWAAVLFQPQSDSKHGKLLLLDWTRPQATSKRTILLHPDKVVDCAFVDESTVVVLHCSDALSSSSGNIRYILQVYNLDNTKPGATLSFSLTLPPLRSGLRITRSTLSTSPRLPLSCSGARTDDVACPYEQHRVDKGLMTVQFRFGEQHDKRSSDLTIVIGLEHFSRFIQLKALKHTRDAMPWAYWGPSMSRILVARLNNYACTSAFGDVSGYRMPFAEQDVRDHSIELVHTRDSWLYRLGILDFNPVSVSWAQKTLQDGRSLPAEGTLVAGTTSVGPDEIFAESCDSSLPYYRAYIEGSHRVSSYDLTQDRLVAKLSTPSEPLVHYDTWSF
ncbi:hypothetical protein K474DRAFT_1707240 [Panus rudis PR-1116 ss-1]|nr:hypothetical protein K474DRAFT_1707240 [Panus rudis PR-1116 ss-1]